MEQSLRPQVAHGLADARFADNVDRLLVVASRLNLERIQPFVAPRIAVPGVFKLLAVARKKNVPNPLPCWALQSMRRHDNVRNSGI